MTHITLDELHELMDDMSLMVRKDDATTLSVPMFADDDFNKNVFIHFQVSPNKIQAWTCVAGYGQELSQLDQLLFCNKWNREKINPRAYIDRDNDFVLDMTIFTDEEISEEYVKDNFIRLSCATMWRFYIELKNHLEGNDEDDEDDSSRSESNDDDSNVELSIGDDPEAFFDSLFNGAVDDEEKKDEDNNGDKNED